MKKNKRQATIVGILFIATMLVGMIDAYYVMPLLSQSPQSILHIDNQLLIGAFSVLIMSVGIVFIALTMHSVISVTHKTLALTYVILRTIECVLLLVGTLCYLFIITLSHEYSAMGNLHEYAIAVAIALNIKFYSFQLAMVILGFGSLFLCYVLYQSQIVPQFLAILGAMGYICLFISAILNLYNPMYSSSILQIILYVPGGLWELIIFPLWLFIKGFK